MTLLPEARRTASGRWATSSLLGPRFPHWHRERAAPDASEGLSPALHRQLPAGLPGERQPWENTLPGAVTLNRNSGGTAVPQDKLKVTL